MTSLQAMPLNQESEVEYWLDITKHVLSGDISPDEALQLLKLDALYTEAFELGSTLVGSCFYLSVRVRPESALSGGRGQSGIDANIDGRGS